MRLHEALSSGRWFHRAIWRNDPLEPFMYRWINGRLEKARAGNPHDLVVSERQFRPGEVLAADWVDWEITANEPGQRTTRATRKL